MPAASYMPTPEEIDRFTRAARFVYLSWPPSRRLPEEIRVTRDMARGMLRSGECRIYPPDAEGTAVVAHIEEFPIYHGIRSDDVAAIRNRRQ